MLPSASSSVGWRRLCYFARVVAVARVPLSTYRLQFHGGFTFGDAHAVVDYLRDLGIRDCYASSYLKAVPGRGEYRPIQATGSRRDCVFAFARGVRPAGGPPSKSDPDDIATTCVPRLIATLTPDGGAPPLGRPVWGDTRIEIGDGRTFRGIFTGASVKPERSEGGYSLSAAAIFERFPVALLVPVNAPARSALPALPALPA